MFCIAQQNSRVSALRLADELDHLIGGFEGIREDTTVIKEYGNILYGVI